MAGSIAGVTNLSGLSLTGPLSMSSNLTLASTVHTYVNGGDLQMGGGTFSLGTWSFSITTASTATGKIPDGNLGLVFRASGLSLVYASGGTLYTLAGSATSGAA